MESQDVFQEQVLLLEKEFQGKIKIRYKQNLLWFWQMVNLILRCLTLGLITWPDFTANSTPLGKTLWTGSDWHKQSNINKMLIVKHERAYFRLIWLNEQGEWRGWLYYCWHLFLYLFFPFPCYIAWYRQFILIHCWQENINYHVATSRNGQINRLLYRRLIRQFSGPAFFYAFTRKGAIRAIQNMIAVAEKKTINSNKNIY